jgi:hypothetical protein
MMEVADRKMSKLDLDRARANFDELEWRTAKRVLEFYEARRNVLAHAPLPDVPKHPDKLQAAG